MKKKYPPSDIWVRYEYQIPLQIYPNNRIPNEDFDKLVHLGAFPTFDFMDARSHLYDHENRIFHRVWHIRFPVNKFNLQTISRSARRIWKKNAGFEVTYHHPFVLTPEIEDLYTRYAENTDFDTYKRIEYVIPISDQEKTITMYDAWAIHVRDGERLVSCGVFYVGDTSAASVLHFFDFAYASYSPGKYLMLLTLNWLKLQGFTWYFPGYVVSRNKKFSYKLFFSKDYEAFKPMVQPVLQPDFGIIDYKIEPWVPFEDWMLNVPPLKRGR